MLAKIDLQFTLPRAVARIDALANFDYESGGDTWLETMNLSDKEDLIREKNLFTESKIQKWAKAYFKENVESDEIMRENCACYDMEGY